MVAMDKFVIEKKIKKEEETEIVPEANSRELSLRNTDAKIDSSVRWQRNRERRHARRPRCRFIFVEESGHRGWLWRLQEKKGPREKGGKFSLKYKGNISTPLDGEFA